MFEYFRDMQRFGAFYRKNGIKTSHFRDLLLEGTIFIVETQNLPQMIFISDVYDYQMFCVSMKCI